MPGATIRAILAMWLYYATSSMKSRIKYDVPRLKTEIKKQGVKLMDVEGEDKIVSIGRVAERD